MTEHTLDSNISQLNEPTIIETILSENETTNTNIQHKLSNIDFNIEYSDTNARYCTDTATMATALEMPLSSIHYEMNDFSNEVKMNKPKKYTVEIPCESIISEEIAYIQEPIVHIETRESSSNYEHNEPDDEHKKQNMKIDKDKLNLLSCILLDESKYIEKPLKETKIKIINGWDLSAIQTLNNWYSTIKELSFSYQFILDRNYKISTSLSMVSVMSSSALSIFSGFKLWIQNDTTFQSSSDIFMMVSNFIVAAITTMSKRYIDDSRNEKMKIYISELDGFIGLICAQITITPEFRMPASKFFETNMKQYTKLMITMPNISIKEMKMAKNNYQSYKSFENQHQSYRILQYNE